MTTVELHALIDAISGHQGWWHEENAETFRQLADRLRAHGLTGTEAVLILEKAYGAVADEFGA